MDAIEPVISDFVFAFHPLTTAHPAAALFVRGREIGYSAYLLGARNMKVVVHPVSGRAQLQRVVIFPTRVVPENPSLLPEVDHVPRLLQVRSNGNGKAVHP